MHHSPAHPADCLCLACVQQRIQALFAAAGGLPLSPAQSLEYQWLLRADYAARWRGGARGPEDDEAQAA